MNTDTEKIISALKNISFGEIILTEGEKSFYADLNEAMIRLGRTLPSSVQAEALLCIMADSRIEPGEDFNVFSGFYVPTWSVIYHVNREAREGGLSMDEEVMAGNAQAMAMFLHSLDDHMNDSEIETTHLLLLLRSQAWCIMIESMKALTLSLGFGESEIERRIDSYYGAITSHEDVADMETYLSVYRNQMATWTIVPFLAALKSSGGDREYPDAVIAAFECFLRAWRFIDDVNDTKEDLAVHRRNALYYLLPDGLRNLWDNGNEEDYGEIFSYISEKGPLQEAVTFIRSELEKGAQILSSLGLNTLSGQFRRLAEPLEKAL